MAAIIINNENKTITMESVDEKFAKTEVTLGEVKAILKQYKEIKDINKYRFVIQSFGEDEI